MYRSRDRQPQHLPDTDLDPPRWIATRRELLEMLRRVSAEPRVALDTEANSLYAYHHRVCLIQVSIPGEDYLIDPLAIADLTPLGELLADPTVEKIFHAADNDVLLLKRDYGFSFERLFDTMVAARILGWPRVSLAALLEEHFGVVLDKRMQRANWGQRPLSRRQQEYARLDTHYLLPLRDIIWDALVAAGRWEEAQEAFRQLCQIEYVPRPFDPEGFWRINGARSLQGHQLSVLRELYLWREQLAEEMDRPPFKVLNDRALIALSRAQPATAAELQAVRGVPAWLVRHRADELLSVIRRGQSADVPQPQPSRANGMGRPDDETMRLYEALRRWRSETARQRGVEADVVLTNDVLMQIARAKPDSMADLAALKVLGEWKLETYGPRILQVIARTRSR